MNQVQKRSKDILIKAAIPFLALLSLVFFTPPHAFSAEEDDYGPKGPVLAEVNGVPIHLEELKAYARANPLFVGYMTHLPGLRRVLDDMINVMLLNLEGELREIPHLEDDTRVRYALRVKARLVEPCKEPDEQGAKRFYEAHPELFRTPPLVRVSRVMLKETDTIHGRPALEYLESKAKAVREGTIAFEALVNEVSGLVPSDERMGDMGFLTLNEEDPLVDLLIHAKKGELVGPYKREGRIYLFLVTDRREPITLSWQEVRATAIETAYGHCRAENFAKLRKEMMKRFPVVMHEENIKAIRFW